MKSKKYYVVWQGRKTGIFETWAECKKQIDQFQGSQYKSFKTRKEAEEAFKIEPKNCLSSSKQNSISSLNISTNSQIIMNSIAVDASCLGNPGLVEYQGVNTSTGEILFHKSPMANGTNNLGEFLAIVHGLAYLKSLNQDIPIYSDSATAILWVKNKKIKTTLKQDITNEEIFNLINRALQWLKNNNYTNQILKWDTKLWGEIPADFGRK